MLAYMRDYLSIKDPEDLFEILIQGDVYTVGIYRWRH